MKQEYIFRFIEAGKQVVYGESIEVRLSRMMRSAKVFYLYRIIGLLLIPVVAQAQYVSLTAFLVTSVYDGDGCKGRFCDTCETVAIRFVGVDAPEIYGYSLKTQPYGRESGDTLRSWIKGKVILLDTLAVKLSRDVYGRLLAEPFFADTSSICALLVERGMAWAVKQRGRAFPKFNGVLDRIMQEAKTANAGLWRSYLTTEGQKARIFRPETWRKRYAVR